MAQSLMRELGALMNSMAGVNPDDDVAVLTETLKRVRSLDPRTTFPGQTVSQRSALGSTSVRKVKSPRNNSRRRVSAVTKEPIPTEKLNVLEQNFKKHHYVSPELRATLAVELDLPPQKIAKWYDNQRAKIKRLERQHVGTSSHTLESRTPDTSSDLDSPRQVNDSGQEADVMQAMAMASSFVEMRQRQNINSGSSCDDEHSSEDEVVAASALQLQLPRSEQQSRRLEQQPQRLEEPVKRAASQMGGRRKVLTQCVSGGGTGKVARMLERNGNTLVSDRQAKRGRLSSSADARIHMR